jgi:CRP-like cAMP-binding protein
VETLEPLIGAHPFFQSLEPPHLRLIVGCARNEQYDEGHVLFREGDPADWFYVIREGQLALEVFVPARGSAVVQTLADGDVLGASWLFPPHHWMFEGRVLRPTRLLAFDGKCLRGKCDSDHHLGYALARRTAQVLVRQLDAARVQLLDLYAAHA